MTARHGRYSAEQKLAAPVIAVHEAAGNRLKTHHYMFTLLCLIGALNFVDRQILGMLVEPIKRDLHVSDTAMGFVTGTTFAVCYLVAGIPLARWADWGVRRSILAMCLAVWSVMTILCGLAQTFMQLVAARFGVAVGEAGGQPTINSLLADLFSRAERGRAMGTVLAANNLGIGLGIFLTGWLDVHVGWRATLAIVGAPGVALALLLRFTVREPPRGRFDTPSEETQIPPLLEVAAMLWRIQSLRWVLAAASLSVMTSYGLLTWAPAFFIRVHGMTTARVGLWLGIETAIALPLASFAGGWLIDLLQVRDVRWYAWLAAISLAAAGPCGLLAFLWPHATGAFILFGLTQFLMTVWAPALYTVTLSLAPVRARALTMTVLTAGSTFVGLGLGPLMVGLLNDTLPFGPTTIRYSMMIVLAGFIVAAFFNLLVARHLKADLS
jgi:predicted MFS family arabinose efflux permease